MSSSSIPTCISVYKINKDYIYPYWFYLAQNRVSK